MVAFISAGFGIGDIVTLLQNQQICLGSDQRQNTVDIFNEITDHTDSCNVCQILLGRNCRDRKLCYENVSRRNLGENCPDHHCKSPGAAEGYLFSKAMRNPGFIGTNDIQDIYLPMGFSNFKIEGRSLGSAIVLEFLLYYMTKPEYHINVREKIYLDSMLDLF